MAFQFAFTRGSIEIKSRNWADAAADLARLAQEFPKHPKAAQSHLLAAYALGKSQTTTTLASSANPAQAGTNVTFTASVNGNGLTGSVAFTDVGSTIAGCAAVALSGSGKTMSASCGTSSLSAGTHSIVATYGGDASNAGSASAPLSQVINGGGKAASTGAIRSFVTRAPRA